MTTSFNYDIITHDDDHITVTSIHREHLKYAVHALKICYGWKPTDKEIGEMLHDGTTLYFLNMEKV